MEIFLNTRGTYPALSGYRLTAVTPMASSPLSKPSEACLFFGILGRCTMMDALDQAERCRSLGVALSQTATPSSSLTSSCKKQSNDQNLIGRESWLFLVSSMTG